MLFFFLAQAQNAAKQSQISAHDRAWISLILIASLLGIGLLVMIGLLAAWRNQLKRQREIEEAHEERDNDMPRADAWATAAQRISPEDTGPDDAHVSPYLEDDEPEAGQAGGYGEDEEEEDDDDFPFGRDDDDEDDKV